MDLEKKYPWSKQIKISKECLSKWKEANTKESLVFWSLKNRELPQKEYFNWAMEYYQMPFLDDMFFEHHIMTKKQWIQVKDMASWTSEFLPLALWDDIVFVGCVDPHFQKSHFNFKHRLILSSSRALQMIWNFTKTLSNTTTKNHPKTQEKLNEKDHLKNQAAGQFFSKPLDTKKHHSHTSSLPIVETKTMKVVSEKGKDSPHIIPFRPISSSPQESSQSSKEKLSSLLNQKEGPQIQKNEILKEKIPVSQTEKISLSSLETDNKDNNILRGDFRSKKFDKQERETRINQTRTVYIKRDSDIKYESLWRETKPFFVTSMVLKVKEDRIYPFVWHGHIRINDVDEALGCLSGYSLFKVVSRGLPYHGFAIDNPDNKNFFHKIGWEKYPQHITAIPIKNEQQKLYQIFVGLGTQHFQKERIKHVEKVIAQFFQSDDQKNSKVA